VGVQAGNRDLMPRNGQRELAIAPDP
jgi:hypothetical protein